jgi:hypothetical protein
MTTEAPEGRPLEDRLNRLPPDRLPPKVKRALTQLGKDLDRVGRRDSHSQEVYIDEPRFRKILEKHLPPSFVGRLIPMIQDQPGGRALIRSADAPRKTRQQASAIPWETVALQKGMRVKQAETFEGLGLHKASSMEDIRNALKPHLADVPDDLFSQELGNQIRQAIDRFASAPEAVGTGMPSSTGQAYWDAFNQCFARYTSSWVSVVFTVFLTAFMIVLIATGNPFAAAIAGLTYAVISIPVWFLIGAVNCFIAAAFA